MMRLAMACAALGLASAAEQGDSLSLLWLYDELDGRGPSNWGTVQHEGAAKYPTCASGKSQSPVDVASVDIDNSLQGMQFSYHAAAGFSVSNRGATVQVVPANNHGNHFVDPNLGNKNWSLAQLHFHAPSEHTIGGGYYDLEMHMVHVPAAQQPDGADTSYDLAVVGVMFRVTTSPNMHLNFFDSLPAMPAGIASHEYYDDSSVEYSPNTAQLTSTFDFGSTLTTGRYYTYNGSLTTPPCSEKVKWIVMSDVNQISQAQLDRFTAALGFTDRKAKAVAKGHTVSPFDVYGNNRPVQARNGRAVRAYTGAEVQATPAPVVATPIPATATPAVHDNDDTAYDLGLAGTVMGAVAIFLVVVVLVFVVVTKPSADAAAPTKTANEPAEPAQ